MRTEYSAIATNVNHSYLNNLIFQPTPSRYTCKKGLYKWADSLGILPSRVNTLKAIISCSDENNMTRASHKGIQAMVKKRTFRDVSARTIVNHMRWLESNNLIKVERSPLWKVTNSTRLLLQNSTLDTQNELSAQCATFTPVYSYNLTKYNNHYIHSTLEEQEKSQETSHVDFIQAEERQADIESDPSAQDLCGRLAKHGVFFGVIWCYLKKHGVGRGWMEWSQVANDSTIRNKGAYWRKKMSSLNQTSELRNVQSPPKVPITVLLEPPPPSGLSQDMPIKATTTPVEQSKAPWRCERTGGKYIREILARNAEALKRSGRSYRTK